VRWHFTKPEPIAIRRGASVYVPTAAQYQRAVDSLRDQQKTGDDRARLAAVALTRNPTSLLVCIGKMPDGVRVLSPVGVN
jgi:hypothetical protein